MNVRPNGRYVLAAALIAPAPGIFAAGQAGEDKPYTGPDRALMTTTSKDDEAQLRGKQASSAVAEDSPWLHAVVTGPDPGGKADKESVEPERSEVKPTLSTSPGPMSGKNPGEEVTKQKRRANSWRKRPPPPSAVRLGLMVCNGGSRP